MKYDTLILLILAGDNDEKYCVESINSILNQSDKSFQLEVIINGSFNYKSKINIYKILKNKKNCKVKIFKVKKKIYSILNIFISNNNKKFKYFCFGSGHDIYLKNWLYENKKNLKKNSNSFLSYCASERIDSKNNFICKDPKPISNLSNDIIKRLFYLRNKNFLFGNAILGLFRLNIIKKTKYRKVLLGDTVFIYENLINGGISATQKKLFLRRFHHYKKKNLYKNQQNQIKRQIDYLNYNFILKIFHWVIINSILIFLTSFSKKPLIKIFLTMICSFAYFDKFKGYIYLFFKKND